MTDSSPGASCYATGNKANNNQHGVFPDDTTENEDNPRVESIGEYLHRTQGRSLGIVTTTDIVLSAYGRGAGLFTGVMDNADVFFKVMRVALGDNRVNQDIKSIAGNPVRALLHENTPEGNEE